MAIGFGDVDGVQETIRANLLNEIDRVKQNLSQTGTLICCDCECEIPEARREAMPSARYCIECQQAHDEKATSYYNRRGSKDSQLR